MSSNASKVREGVFALPSSHRDVLPNLAGARSNRLREDTLSIVAHDLKDPLATIQAAAGFLLEVIPYRVAEAVERNQLLAIRRSADRMSRLVNDLLDIAASDAGRLHVRPVRLRPNVLVNDALELLQPLADGKGISLLASVPPDLPRVDADRERVLQVFSNIGGNAIKFTPRGGSVDIRVAPREAAVEFELRDTGCGIAADDLPYIFDPFWKAERTGRQGTGLGLAIAKAIVEAHGGELRVASGPHGSLFAFTIPLTSGDVQSAPEAS